MAKKFVYLFSEGDAGMRNLLGGKGANLAEMTKLGLPVPQGFTVTTEACTQYYDDGKKINFIQPTEINTFVATTVALCASILWNFTLNRKFTFKDASNVPKAMILAFLFYVPFYPFQTWYVCTIEPLLSAKINATLAGIIAEGSVMVINFVLEFMWQKFVVFRKPKAKKTEETVKNEDVRSADEQSDTNEQ